MSLKSQLLNHLTSDWTSGTSVEDWVRANFPRKASNASRRLRELAQDGLIERKIDRQVYYRIADKKIFYEIKPAPAPDIERLNKCFE